MGKTEILTTNEHIKKNLYICYSSFSKKMFLSYEQPQRSKEICCAFFCYGTKVNLDNKGLYQTTIQKSSKPFTTRGDKNIFLILEPSAKPLYSAWERAFRYNPASCPQP